MFDARMLVVIGQDQIEIFDSIKQANIYKGPCEVFINKNGIIAGIGDSMTESEKCSSDLIVVNPLSSNRILIHDFLCFVALMQHYIKKAQRFPLLLIKPIVFIQIIRKFDDGVSSAEYKLIIDAMRMAGCRKVYIKRSGEVTFQEQLAKSSKVFETGFVIG